jgi:hypothetical protein
MRTGKLGANYSEKAEEKVMMRELWTAKGLGLLGLALVLSLTGCSAGTTLCTRHLYLFRDTPKKVMQTSELALLVTDPELAQRLLPGNRYLEPGCRWQSPRPHYETDEYSLSIEQLDGKAVFQGWCLDSPPTFACEVRPGTRQVSLRCEMVGPEGNEKAREVASLTLEPGKCYFLRPDCEALKGKRFQFKVVPLPEPYTPELRARLIDLKRQTVKGVDE